MIEILVAMFLTGLLFGSGACLISCGPVLVSYICATDKKVRQSLGAYFLFSLSRISMYIVLSACFFLIGEQAVDSLFADYGRYIYITAGFFLALLGAYFIMGRRMELKPFNLVYKHIVKGDTKNMVILGAVYGLLPCGPFLGVLSYIGLVSKSLFQSVLYALFFGAGTFFSLLIVLAAAGGSLSWLLSGKAAIISKILRVLCGITALYLAAQLIGRAF